MQHKFPLIGLLCSLCLLICALTAFSQWTTNLDTNVVAGANYSGVKPGTNAVSSTSFTTNTFGTNATGSYAFRTNTFGTNVTGSYAFRTNTFGTNTGAGIAYSTNVPGSARTYTLITSNTIVSTNSIIVASAGTVAVNGTYWLTNGFYSSGTSSNLYVSGFWYFYIGAVAEYAGPISGALLGSYGTLAGSAPGPTVTAGNITTNSTFTTNVITRF